MNQSSNKSSITTMEEEAKPLKEINKMTKQDFDIIIEASKGNKQ